MEPVCLTELDVLVFSSHKSGTQSLVQALRAAGCSAVHAHSLPGLGLCEGQGQLQEALARHAADLQRPLRVISVFREPLDRHLASLFQWHGDGVIRKGLVARREDTAVVRLDGEALQELLVAELREHRLVGQRDSLHGLCQELRIPVLDLFYAETARRGLYRSGLIELHLFRFDQLFPSFPAVIREAMGLNLQPVRSNIGAEKWYAAKYLEFRQKVKLPTSAIEMVYAEKRDLIDVFYPGRFEALLTAALARYAS